MAAANIPATVQGYRQRPPCPDRIQGGARSKQMDPSLPVVSIVCTCRNVETVLERSIESVKAQDYPNIEFIITDAASTDGTVSILRKYSSAITFWVSERDLGRADGFNKALSYATGDYVAAVMADDWLAPDFVSKGIAALKTRGVDYVFGDCMLHSEDGAFLYRRIGDPNFAGNLRYWMTVNSPSFMVRRAMLDSIGLFADISVASDYDWFLRAHLAGFRGTYDPSLLYHFRMGGVSTTSAFKAYRENAAIALKYGAKGPIVAAVFTGVLLRHGAQRLLHRLLPDDVVLALRRYRQNRRRRQNMLLPPA